MRCCWQCERGRHDYGVRRPQRSLQRRGGGAFKIHKLIEFACRFLSTGGGALGLFHNKANLDNAGYVMVTHNI